MAMETSKSEDKQLDFSQPWKLSDVVLVVEEERIHVHRAVLSISSPVFEKMFTSEFREKDNIEVPLPGKLSAEVKELLLMIYPSASDKQITEETCLFILKLAHEYQMDAIVKRCEDFLVEQLKSKPKGAIVSELVFAQIYKLEKLRKASIEEAYNIGLEQLKENDMYDQIESENLKEIMEGVITRLQKQLEEYVAQNQQKESKLKAAKTRMLSVSRDLIHSIAKFLWGGTRGPEPPPSRTFVSRLPPFLVLLPPQVN